MRIASYYFWTRIAKGSSDLAAFLSAAYGSIHAKERWNEYCDEQIRRATWKWERCKFSEDQMTAATWTPDED